MRSSILPTLAWMATTRRGVLVSIPASASLPSTCAGKNVFGRGEFDRLESKKMPVPRVGPLGVRRKGCADISVTRIGRCGRKFHRR